MELPQTGGCQCGKVRYEITQAPQSAYTCHCTACQRLTSSAFSMGLVVARRGLSPGRRRAQASAAGQHPAGVSGVRLHLRPAGVVRVRAGSLDDTSWLRPTRHIWTRSKQPLIIFAPGDEVFEAQPPA